MRIGFIGLGIMGESMCENIVKKHDDKVFVYDFVKEKVDKLGAAGAISCNSSKEVAENSDIIITMVPKSENSMSVYKEILPCLRPDMICVDMSTIDPAVSISIAELVCERRAEFADAPVVKSKPAAIAGKLGIYVGGKQKVYEKILPILHYMGENVIYMGTNGKGLIMKLCHNALVSQIQNGVNETVMLAAANDIDIMTYAEAISYGGGQNFYLDSKKVAIQKYDFTTAFSIENMHKDVNLCMKLAKESGVQMPGEENVAKVYDEAMKEGCAKEDFSATIKIVEAAMK